MSRLVLSRFECQPEVITKCSRWRVSIVARSSPVIGLPIRKEVHPGTKVMYGVNAIDGNVLRATPGPLSRGFRPFSFMISHLEFAPKLIVHLGLPQTESMGIENQECCRPQSQ